MVSFYSFFKNVGGGEITIFCNFGIYGSSTALYRKR